MGNGQERIDDSLCRDRMRLRGGTLSIDRIDGLCNRINGLRGFMPVLFPVRRWLFSVGRA